MILGIGIDTVNIDRFDEYHLQPITQLNRLFSQEEIAYCLKKERPATHFAARFAAREAFFKAYQAMLCLQKEKHPANLFTINKKMKVLHTDRGAPYIKADWSALLPKDTSIPKVHISITHTSSVATVFIVLSNNN